ncbi:MAG: hypothetical protein WAL89_21865 [Candidatus Sulfotelmatobacter sp.]
MRVSILLIIISWGTAWAQGKQDTTSAGAVYSDPAVGFRYTAPSGMRDKTERSRAEVKGRAGAVHANTLDLLLAMSSGPNDAIPDWCSLTIETYPRQALSNLDDISAEAKMSAWVAGIDGLPGTPRFVVISGQSFAVYVFGERRGSMKKGALVWTTIRRGKLLSFAFVANSAEQLKALAETMKTVQLF